MADYWLDSNALIFPKDNGYSFDLNPGFWAFIAARASEGVIKSPMMVYEELADGQDELAEWVKAQKDLLFVEPNEDVQNKAREVMEYVHANYEEVWAKKFLDGADPWLIAHASALGGQAVTFEVPAGNSPKVKIPDVAPVFGVTCIRTWQMLRDLGAQFS